MVAILFSGAEPLKQINTLSIEDFMWNLVKIEIRHVFHTFTHAQEVILFVLS